MGQGWALGSTKLPLGCLSLLRVWAALPGGLIKTAHPWRKRLSTRCSLPGGAGGSAELSPHAIEFSSPHSQAPVISFLLLKNLLIMLNVCAPPPVYTPKPNPQHDLEKESVSK